ncbi:MAG: type IV secretory pathway TrbF-like protein [Francisellaceae bacterium]|jgi:type IV secretory pathway TrbF-like protein
MAQNKDVNQKYQDAYDEWESRIGSAKTQVRNWRLACLLSIIVVLLLIICILMQMSMKERYVYVAEIKPQNSIINVRPVTESYVPTVAQKEAFVAEFIKNIMEIPLDPVVLNRQWTIAQQSVQGQSQLQLKQFARSSQPNSQVGQVTQSIKIVNMSNLGSNSFEVTWQQTTVNMEGKTQSILLFGGVFTLTQSIPPNTFQQMLINPLGLRLGYFSFNQKGSSR